MPRRRLSRRMTPTLLALAATAVIAAGCRTPLPTAQGVPGPAVGIDICAGVGLDAFLHGDPTDPRTAWLVRPDGGRQDLLFPAGYTAVFAPTLQVLDPTGRVAMAEGDFVYGACVGPGDELTIDPAESLTLDCGPVPPDSCRDYAPSIAANQAGHDHREVVSVRYTSADGDDVVTFEDGTTAQGQADLGG